MCIRDRLSGVFEIFWVEIDKRMRTNFEQVWQNSVTGFKKKKMKKVQKNVFFVMISENNKVTKKPRKTKKESYLSFFVSSILLAEKAIEIW